MAILYFQYLHFAIYALVKKPRNKDLLTMLLLHTVSLQQYYEGFSRQLPLFPLGGYQMIFSGKKHIGNRQKMYNYLPTEIKHM